MFLSEAYRIAISEAVNLEIPWKKRVSYVKRRVRETLLREKFVNMHGEGAGAPP